METMKENQRLVDSARTLLFVPGDRPERFGKAVRAGADLVVLDLEDAVSPANKERARKEVAAWLGRGGTAIVRINGASTPWHREDLAAVSAVAAGIMMPKAEAGSVLSHVTGSHLPVVALVETANGVLDARSIAMTSGVRRLALGSFDLAAELGIDPSDPVPLAAARAALVLASAAAALPGPIDGVCGAATDQAAVRDEASLARRLGYAGKLCIHPAQIQPALVELQPKTEEIAWATTVLEANTDEGGVALVDGRMVDKPVVDRARRLLGLRSLPAGSTPTEVQRPEGE